MLFISIVLVSRSRENSLSYEFIKVSRLRTIRCQRTKEDPAFDANALWQGTDLARRILSCPVVIPRLRITVVCHTISQIGKRITSSHLCHRQRETRRVSVHVFLVFAVNAANATSKISQH